MSPSLAGALIPLLAEGVGWCLRAGPEKTMGMQVKPAVEDRIKAVIQRWLEASFPTRPDADALASDPSASESVPVTGPVIELTS